jgi:hypothetical protein
MDDMIGLMWEQAQKTLYIDREAFIRSLDGWALDPQYNEAGELVCVWLTKGPQLHFATFGKPWNLTRDDIRKRLCPLIERYGHAETFTPKEDARQHRFNKLIGFVAKYEDQFYIHYKIERLRHA